MYNFNSVSSLHFKMIHSNKSIAIFGLLISCPMGFPMDDCPLEQYRLGAVKDKMRIVENFTTVEIDEILKHHNECLWRQV